MCGKDDPHAPFLFRPASPVHRAPQSIHQQYTLTTLQAEARCGRPIDRQQLGSHTSTPLNNNGEALLPSITPPPDAAAEPAAEIVGSIMSTRAGYQSLDGGDAMLGPGADVEAGVTLGESEGQGKGPAGFWLRAWARRGERITDFHLPPLPRSITMYRRARDRRQHGPARAAAATGGDGNAAGPVPAGAARPVPPENPRHAGAPLHGGRGLLPSTSRMRWVKA